MKPVNPELMSEGDPSIPLPTDGAEFSNGVEKLFGTKNRNVRRAVAEFLAKDIGSLDHHNLRLVAASVGAFDDVNHLAYVIERLKPTGLDIAAKPIDLETARAEFVTSLPDRYRPETKRNLVLDLINRTTLDILSNAPPERIPEQGKAIVREHQRKLILRGTEEDRDHYIDSPFDDGTFVDAALDHIEQRLDRASEEGGQSGRVRAADFDPTWFRLLDHQAPRSDSQLTKAWALYQRCRPDAAVLSHVTSDQRIMAMFGDSVLRAVDEYERLGGADERDRASELRARILGNPSTPEEVARQAVPMSTPPTHGDVRLARLRQQHYNRTDALLPRPFAPADLDSVVESLRVFEITGATTRSLETSEGLYRMIEISDTLRGDAFEGLVTNKHLKPAHIAKLIELVHPERHPWTGPNVPRHFEWLLRYAAIDDHQLASLVGKIETSVALTPEKKKLMLHMTALNKSSGPAVWAMLEHHCRAMPDVERSRLLRRIALASPSPQLHDAMTRWSIENGDQRLANNLMTNPVLRSTNWRLLQHEFPHIEPSIEVARALAGDIPRNVPPGAEHIDVRELLSLHQIGYSQHDVTSLVMSGDGSQLGVELLLSEHWLNTHANADLLCELGDSHFGEGLLEMTSNPDTHVALAAATSPRMLSSDRESEFVLPAVKELRDTAYAVDHGIGEFPDDRKLHSWKRLPNRNEEPLSLTELHELIDGQVIGGLTVEVVKSRRQLIEASEQMRNCLAGYADEVAEGKRIVVLAYAETDIYAAAFDVGDDSDNRATDRQLDLIEVNSKFNEGNVPAEFEAELETMIDRLNDGTLQPVERASAALVVEPPDVEVDAEPNSLVDIEFDPNALVEIESSTPVEGEVEPPGNRRPPRRRALPALRTHLDQVRVERQVPGSPSLLAGTEPEVSQEQTMTPRTGDVDEPDQTEAPAVDPTPGRTLDMF